MSCMFIEYQDLMYGLLQGVQFSHTQTLLHQSDKPTPMNTAQGWEKGAPTTIKSNNDTVESKNIKVSKKAEKTKNLKTTSPL